MGLEKAYIKPSALWTNAMRMEMQMNSHKLNQGGRQKFLMYQIVVPMVATSWYGKFDSACLTFFVDLIMRHATQCLHVLVSCIQKKFDFHKYLGPLMVAAISFSVLIFAVLYCTLFKIIIKIHTFNIRHIYRSYKEGSTSKNLIIPYIFIILWWSFSRNRHTDIQRALLYNIN